MSQISVDAKFVVKIYEKDEFCIFKYKLLKPLQVGTGKPISELVCKGNKLCKSKNTVTLTGELIKDPKYGVQLKVFKFDEHITLDKDGIIGYLSSGQIKGCGPKTAQRIYEKFGDKTLDILDKMPSRLKEIPGIGSKKLESIKDSYVATRFAKEVVGLLSKYGVSAKKALKFFEIYGKDAVNIVQTNPYKLCEVDGIGFKTADVIARNVGVSLLSAERVEAALKYVLEENEHCGSTAMGYDDLMKKFTEVTDPTPNMTRSIMNASIRQMISDNRIDWYNKTLSLHSTSVVEERLADGLMSLAKKKPALMAGNVLKAIADLEKKTGMTYAEEQVQAIQLALGDNCVAVITGGPGTGKTAIQRAIIDIHKMLFPKAEITCCAPTGKAARRMSEATGHVSSTIHRALGLGVQGSENPNTPKAITGDLIIVDEISMLDTLIADALVGAVKDGARLVLVGDKDQLPSVGAGTVLRDIIFSEKIPVVKLEKVFRQKANSRIAINSKLMKYGNKNLEFGPDFQFIATPTAAEGATKIANLYKSLVATEGIDNVCMLSPMRAKPETGVNPMNQLLRNMINPPVAGKTEATIGDRQFRTGDKVIQMKNFEDVANGDIGYIEKITNDEGFITVHINFGPDVTNGKDRIKEYDTTQLQMIDHAYALTVHKSQGSEYKTVIISLQKSQFVMLNRALIYTAITRAKSKVIIVGEMQALYMAINRVDESARITNLQQRILDLC